MTIATIDTILNRVRGAAPQSPIAIFRSDRLGQFNAVFASTVETQNAIRRNDPNLIGVYDKNVDLHYLAQVLRAEALT